jgi:hypothetical protein
MKPWPELGIEDVEVVQRDPTLLLDEFEHRRAWPGRSFLGTKDPLELRGSDDGLHPEMTVTLGFFEMGRT